MGYCHHSKDRASSKCGQAAYSGKREYWQLRALSRLPKTKLRRKKLYSVPSHYDQPTQLCRLQSQICHPFLRQLLCQITHLHWWTYVPPRSREVDLKTFTLFNRDFCNLGWNSTGAYFETNKTKLISSSLLQETLKACLTGQIIYCDLHASKDLKIKCKPFIYLCSERRY